MERGPSGSYQWHCQWTKEKLLYSIDKLQDRGRFFVDPAEEVYHGQVIGESIRPGDLVINVTRAKQLANMRASK